MKAYSGLNDFDASEMRKKYGSNKLSDKKQETFFQKYFKSFDDPIITILLAALFVNVIFTFFGKVDWFECAGIFLSVILSTFISTLSEYKNEKNFNLLSEEASKSFSKAYRGGQITYIPTDDIVAGDLILLQQGDLIPADGVIIDGKISVNQSSLNGENKELEKFPDKGFNYSAADLEKYRKRAIDFWSHDTLYRGTAVTQGECVMAVHTVGDGTAYGELNSASDVFQLESPLTVKLRELSTSISKFGYVGAFLTFMIIMLQRIFGGGFELSEAVTYFGDFTQVLSDLAEAVIMGIIVIVVAVPEGLPLMIAIVCSLNMKKMLKSNVLVRRLSGIETAGSLNILFCDKTGTITNGRLEASTLVCGNLKSIESISKTYGNFKKMLCVSIAGNSSVRLNGESLVGGNSTEKALYNFLLKEKDIKLPAVSVDEFKSFSSESKYSAARVAGSFSGTLFKGAPEIILPHCKSFLSEDGHTEPLGSLKKIDSFIDASAKKQNRIIALAYTEEKKSLTEISDNLTLLALVVLKDSIRYNVKGSIEAVKRAGISVVMITGDKKETAAAIAKEAGIIVSADDIILTSSELGKMSDTEVKALLPKIKVLSRAVPTDKSRLVRIAQESGMVTGMTGDGVNDCPALRQADVGFSMGSGTEAAKEAGDIIILDDNLTSIKNAVLYGRTIYKSIKKFIAYQLTINLAAVSVSVLGPLTGVYKPLNISQMLWINLVMDTLAAIAFGGEAALGKYLLEKPKRRNEKIIDKKMWSGVIYGGLFIAAVSLIMFCSEFIRSLFREGQNDIYFYTGYFSFFIFSSIFNAFNARCEGIDLSDHLSCNKPFILIISAIFIIQIAMTYFGGSMLQTAGLTVREWLTVTALAVLIIPADLMRKLILKR